MKIYHINTTKDELIKNVPNFWMDEKQEQKCLHQSCPQCEGTGLKKDGSGACIHMISCPCPRCSFR